MVRAGNERITSENSGSGLDDEDFTNPFSVGGKIGFEGIIIDKIETKNCLII